MQDRRPRAASGPWGVAKTRSPRSSFIALASFLVDWRPGRSRFSPLRCFLPFRLRLRFCAEEDVEKALEEADEEEVCPGRLSPAVGSVGEFAAAKAAADSAIPDADEGRAAPSATSDAEEADEEDEGEESYSLLSQ